MLRKTLQPLSLAGGNYRKIDHQNYIDKMPCVQNLMNTWPPPIIGQQPPDDAYRAPSYTTKRGFALVLFSSMLLAVGLLMLVPIWVAGSGILFTTIIGVALSVTDLRNCRKAADSMGVIWNSLGILCNVLPFVILNVVGIFDA